MRHRHRTCILHSMLRSDNQKKKKRASDRFDRWRLMQTIYIEGKNQNETCLQWLLEPINKNIVQSMENVFMIAAFVNF